MWRGFHKLGDDVFEKMVHTEHTFPSASSAGQLKIPNPENVKQHLFAQVFDDVPFDDEEQTDFCDAVIEATNDFGFEQALLNTGDTKQEVGEANDAIRKGKRCIINSPDIAARIWKGLQTENCIPSKEAVPGKRYLSKDGSDDWIATGVNPKIRVLKYDENDFFEAHQDGSYEYQDVITGVTYRSFLTLQIYLNDGGGGVESAFKGGATRFFFKESDAIKATKTAKTSKKKGGKGVKEAQTRAAGAESENLPSPLSPCSSPSSTTTTSTATSSTASSSTPFRVEDVVPRRGRVLLFQHNIWHEGERVESGCKLVLRSEIMYCKRDCRDRAAVNVSTNTATTADAECVQGLTKKIVAGTGSEN